MTKSPILFAALCVTAVFAAPAMAANGSTSQGIQMQAGPGSDYPDVMRLAPNLKVTIHGCSRTWDWCDVEWRGNRGWVPAATIDYRRGDTLFPVANFGPRIGLPQVDFNLGSYWNAHYRQRPWYAQRQAWATRTQPPVRVFAEVTN